MLLICLSWLTKHNITLRSMLLALSLLISMVFIITKPKELNLLNGIQGIGFLLQSKNRPKIKNDSFFLGKSLRLFLGLLETRWLIIQGEIHQGLNSYICCVFPPANALVENDEKHSNIFSSIN